MRIAVTGGTGKLGRAVVAGLRKSGDQVFNLDTAAQRPDIRVDLTDYGQTLSALTAVDDKYSKIDAVVHLAAVPAPGVTTNAATFHNNITATYNVFAAAAAAGITNVVWASSETLLGIPFETPPPYIPLDEEYPARPEWHYALAKHLEETMAAQFCRWNPALKMIGLRFSNVMEPADYAEFPSFDADPQLRKWNLWGYIDARDGAQAVRKALDHNGTGVEIFIIANADTVMSRSSASLAAEVYPDVPVTRSLGEHETLLSIDKARRILGYEPEHSWRQQH
ncbi:NAD(P)-dependent oxidoreductase [Actinoplanes sp. NPDC026619]|uniref:NAD-dependent epimerase/dehydratase family protein n=1 Tax=Actinoplanes sp. NPDC026619 TaxID=3155798 RepID=UPI00340646CA